MLFAVDFVVQIGDDPRRLSHDDDDDDDDDDCDDDDNDINPL